MRNWIIKLLGGQIPWDGANDKFSMKTKISDYHIDLSRVFAIGPLTTGTNRMDGSSSNRFGFSVYLNGGRGESMWIEASQETFDPCRIDGDANEAVKARAKETYSKFVEEWKGTLGHV